MAKRGRILNDPTAGPGRVMVQGRQHEFGLDGVWKSDALPRPGIVVDVEFDDAGHIRAMTVVPETRLIREQVEAALALARSRGANFGASVLDRFGPMQFAAIGALAIGWIWFLTSGHLASRSYGVHGVIAIACLAGPMLACVWKDRRAYLASLLPLAFTLVVVLQGLKLVPSAGVEAISLNAGAYLVALASVYLALAGIKRFLVAKAHDEAVFHENE